MRILILGASGMLGSALLGDFYVSGMDVFGSARSATALHAFSTAALRKRLLDGVNAYDVSSVSAAIDHVSPTVVINCIGLVRQLPEGRQPLPCIEINARFPHLLLQLCSERGIRLIHYSTDCVFDGQKGAPYTEDDPPSAKDVYGLSKFLGEVKKAPALTIRTSIIGHELRNKLSLVEWFLEQEGTVKGYTRAIYSGLPVTEQARILREYILPNPGLCGLYHVAGNPISKCDLLHIIAKEYRKNIVIKPDDDVNGDKRLDGALFAAATGYIAPDWITLIREMRQRHYALMHELSAE